MEKYGFVPDDALSKKAGVGNKCPNCGKDLTTSNPPICSDCGSLPVEKEDGKSTSGETDS